MPRTSPVLPPRSQWLTAGGDERLAIDPASGRNRYGCPAQPDPLLCALGSSTASPISPAALLAAETLHQQLQTDLDTTPPAAVFAQASARIAHELRALCQLDDLPGLAITLTASGTDAHQLAVRHRAKVCGAPLAVLTVAAEETGSGVPAAITPSAARTGAVALRLPDGAPRNAADIDADFARLAELSIAAGNHVLLVLADVSKSGLIAPTPALAAELHRRWPERCDILVDACQFRLSNCALREYLDRGFTVAITGSKFFGGPSFAGALLTPASPYPATENQSLNFGLLLRWQAALSEMRAFYAIGDEELSLIISELSDALKARLETSPVCIRLPSGTLTRLSPVSAPQSWDSLASIFPFRLHHPDSGAPFTPEATRQVYQLMQQDVRQFPGCAASAVAAERFLLGQPVLCGMQDGVPLSALRLCLSARMIAMAATSSVARRQLIARTLSALDKIELIAAHLRF